MRDIDLGPDRRSTCKRMLAMSFGARIADQTPPRMGISSTAMMGDFGCGRSTGQAKRICKYRNAATFSASIHIELGRKAALIAGFGVAMPIAMRGS